MPSPKKLPDINLLREVFRYEEAKLVWNVRPIEHFQTYQAWKAWNTKFSNKPSGCFGKKGYIEVRFSKRSYKAHRIIYALVHGDVLYDIDHVNGDCVDNRIENLRVATATENNCNQRLRSDNLSGIKGVYWNPEKNRWIAQISKNKKTTSKSFVSVNDAETWVTENRLKIHMDFANHG